MGKLDNIKALGMSLKPLGKMNSNERKLVELDSVLDYFPNALSYVSLQSSFGNVKHNPDAKQLTWSKHLSNDHRSCIMRHLVNVEEVDEESGMIHAVSVAWRALAQLEMLILKADKKELYDHLMDGKPESEYKRGDV